MAESFALGATLEALWVALSNSFVKADDDEEEEEEVA